MKLHAPVLFIGDRPNPAKNRHLDVPFVGTTSYRTLLDWLARMDVDISLVRIVNANSVDGKMHQDLPQLITAFTKIVALGSNAATRLDELNEKNIRQIEYFKLPHPSGLNREVNDKKKLTDSLIRCRNYIYKEA